MKLHELKLGEGLVDTSILNVIRDVVANGITDGAQTVAIARSLMAISDGKVGIADNFNEYYNGFFPDKGMIDSLKALSKPQHQQLATFILRVLETKDTQLASLVSPFVSVENFLYYATAAEAND